MTDSDESECVQMEEQREIDEDAAPKSKRIKMRRDILEGKFNRMFDNKNTSKNAVSKAKRVKRVMSDPSDDEANGVDDKIDDKEDDNVISKSRRRLLSDSEDDDGDKRDDVTKSKNNRKVLSDSENEDELVNEETKIAPEKSEDSSDSNESSSKHGDVSNVHNLKGLVDSDSDSDDNVVEKKVSQNVEMTKSASASKVQRMSAKQAMENMQKIKSEANRMLRTKNASLPYHQPTQISLKDIFASKFKTAKDTPKSDEVSRADADILIENNQMNKYEETLIENDDDDLPIVNVNEIATENTEILSAPHEPRAQLDSEEIPTLRIDTTEEGNDADEDIEDATIDDLIERMEKEEREDDSTKEATVVKPTKTLEETEDLIDLTSGTVDVPKKLTGVELLRENFIKHNALKTAAEIQREPDKKNKNRIFELKQSLGDMIVQQRIKEWISRESETQDNLREDEEEAESGEDGKLGDKILDDVEGTDESDTDSSSSSSDDDNHGAENHDEDGPEVEIAEKISKRIIRNSDDSEEEELAEKEEFNPIEKTAEDIAAVPETNDFILNLDTQSDDVFSPNKTLNASQMKSQSAESEDIISMVNEPVKIVPMKDYLADESITEEVESQDKTIVDESELMDLCTGKFMDGLIQDSDSPQFQLTLGNSLGSPVTQNCKKNPDMLTQWSDAETINKNIDESDKKSDSGKENNGRSLLNRKGKMIIMSSDEESKEKEVDKSRKKKLLKKRDRMKSRRIAVISDESSSSSDEFEYDAFDDDTNSDGKAAVEYDSEENEVVAASKPKAVQAGEFFENEAQLTSEDEGKGSGDEDEADLDTLEREEGDDDKFNERKMKKQLERIHMRQILDEDKREVRLLQEILLEDGDLNGRSRERKFKWKDFEWSADPSGNAEGEGSQTIEDMESEAVWRKQRHEREAYLREMKLKEKSANADAEDKLDNHISYVAACSKTTTTKEINVNQAAVPSPKKDSLLTIRRTSANFSRHATSLNRLSALLESTSSNNDETGIIGTKVDANSKGLVFAKSSPARSKDSDLMAKKRKAEENVSPGAKKSSLNAEPKIRRGLLDFIEL